jgi:hypothetical protein
MIVGLCYAVAATVLNTLAGLLESAGARATATRLPLALRPRYLAGLLVDGAGWLCTVAALQRIPVLRSPPRRWSWSSGCSDSSPTPAPSP